MSCSCLKAPTVAIRSVLEYKGSRPSRPRRSCRSRTYSSQLITECCWLAARACTLNHCPTHLSMSLCTSCIIIVQCIIVDVCYCEASVILGRTADAAVSPQQWDNYAAVPAASLPTANVRYEINTQGLCLLILGVGCYCV